MQDVGDGLGPARPGSDAAEVELLSGRAGSHLLSHARSEAGVGCGGKLTKTRRSAWCASGFQGRTRLSNHVEVVCGRGGENGVSIMGLRI